MARSPRIFTLAGLLIFAATLVICCLSAEAIMRYKIFGAQSFSYLAMKHVRHIGESGLLQASAHRDLLWELKPNVAVPYKLTRFATNSQGMRDREYSLVKPPHTFRIAVVGDSFTMGEGVEVGEVYHSLIEQKLNDAPPSKTRNIRTFEVLNFGVAGYSLIQYPPTIRRKVLPYQPDLVLIGFCAANDSKLPNLGAFNRPYQVKPPANGFYHFYFFELLGDGYKRIYNRLRGRMPGDNADPGYVHKQFQILASLEKRLNVPIVIAYIDNKAASTDFELVRSEADLTGLDFIDATTPFGREIDESHIIYLTDNHPNAAANRLLAGAIYPRLAEIITRELQAATAAS